MPYSSMDAAKEADFPTSLKAGGVSVPLSLAQVNRLAELYDAIKSEGEADNPMAAAIAQFKREFRAIDGAWVKRKQMADDEQPQKLVPLKVKSLFGPGRWKSGTGWVRKTAQDCEAMVSQFHEFLEAGRIRPTYKTGHKAQKKDDSDPTMAPLEGVIDDMWWDPAGNRIDAQISVKPEVAEDIEQNRLTVSLEFDDHWWDGVAGRYRDNVVRHVSGLGAAHPAWTGQTDRLAVDRANMSEDREPAVRYCLSMDNAEPLDNDETNGGGEEDVEETEKLKARIAELEAELESLRAKGEDESDGEPDETAEELAALKEQLDLEKKAREAAEAKIAEADAKAKEATVDAALDKAVEEQRMTPAEKPVEKARLMSADDTKTVKLADADGKEVEKSEFELGLEALAKRARIYNLSEQGSADADDVTKPEEPKKSSLSETDIEVAKATGISTEDMERYTSPEFDVASELAKKLEEQK